MALGVDTDTPRDGTRRNPFQQDSTRFRGNSADTVGETLANGDNNLESGTRAIMSELGDQLPQITPGGEVQMTLHQVNGDGAGPYTCMINDDGTAETWTEIEVTQQVPGRRGNRRRGSETDFPLTAAIPADQECTGEVAGQENVCLVRCENPARAGPFGGVVPVQIAGTSTAEEARRKLARVMRRNNVLKRELSKRQEDLDLMEDPEFLAELIADGEEF